MKKRGNTNFETILLYRGSDYKFQAKDFHRLCDGKGPTVTLFKIEESNESDGDCIGGYTQASWSSPDKFE